MKRVNMPERTISAPGTYQATLTDFEFPEPFKSLKLAIGTPTDLVGVLTKPGSFKFDVLPDDTGSYFAAVLGLAGKDYNLGLYGVEVKQMAAVPVPASLLLLGSGLVGLISVKRKIKG